MLAFWMGAKSHPTVQRREARLIKTHGWEGRQYGKETEVGSRWSWAKDCCSQQLGDASQEPVVEALRRRPLHTPVSSTARWHISLVLAVSRVTPATRGGRQNMQMCAVRA